MTANPIGCAVALASLELATRNEVPFRLDAIGRRIEAGLTGLAARPDVRDLRRRGGIVALDLIPPGEAPGGYLAPIGPELRRRAVARGVLLRPLGNVLYALPPACVTDAECDEIAAIMRELVGGAT
jgi:adenosylmethionine-8-amino-7-oxononanoate aminotransferase